MPLLAAVSLLSLAAIAYEILLTRLFAITLWHHYVYMIISLALLGYGASGTFLVFVKHRLIPHFGTSFAVLAMLFGVTVIGCYVLAQRVPFNPLEVIWDWHQQLYLATMYLILAAPFFAAASAIALALAVWPGHIGAIYRADLMGAGAGALGVVAATFVLPLEDCLRVIAASGFGAAALAVTRERRHWAAAAILVVAVPATLAWPAAWLAPTPSPYKSLSLALTAPEARVIAERSGPLGRLSVIESPKVPLRIAPGLSLATTLMPPAQLGVFTDGEGVTPITRSTGDLEPIGYLDQQTSALPYHLLDRPETLVLGAGGGADVLQALYHRASHIDAVELNPQLADLVRHDFADFAGRIYDHPAVALHMAEARSFVEASRKRWDLINLSLLDSFATSTAGAQALSESPIYTIEAFQAYIGHLAPNGMLAITRWLGNPPRDTFKLFAIATAALRANGAADPAEQLVLLHSWNTATLLIKDAPFSRDEIAAARTFARDRQFDLAWFAGIRASETNRFNRMAKPTLYDAAVALLGPARSDFIANYRFDIRPATDDQPFFFRFFRWSLLPHLAAMKGQAGFVFVDAGYLVLILALLQAIVLSGIFILIPLLWLRHEQRVPASGWMSVALYFLLVGFAFLFIEIAFIQRFSLFLGHPLTAIAVTLAGFLVFAGLGSGFSTRAAARWPRATIILAVGAIVAIGAGYVALLPLVFDTLMGWPLLAKSAVAAGLVAPLGFAMGFPFPLGLSRVAERTPALLPWAWGINGCASVVSAVAASLLAMHIGFTAVLAVAIGLYGAAALLFGRLRGAT
ncbi:polyamine aminopropyltransferase [Dongia deserti]|uniref:SAM-dependent methyltransferase n=1 Tax=Dongia deserti TaxID=2268030 RepID=UPI000E657F3E|nr:SAM-dependent methyltransferase [Dongia deserti]